MAGINLSSVILEDRWPGAVNPNMSIPTDGWDNTTDCYKTTATTDLPRYPLGTKIMAYTDNSWAPGWYTMMYLMYHSMEAAALYDVSKDISVGGMPLCIHADGSHAQHYNQQGDTSTIPYYVVTKCVTTLDTDLTEGSPVCLPCWTASSDGTGSGDNSPYVRGYGDSFGWFWVGGVCPAKDATIFDGAGAGVGSVCRGIGANIPGDFPTRSSGNLYWEITAATGTLKLTNDLTCVIADATYALPLLPIGWSCMTAI